MSVVISAAALLADVQVEAAPTDAVQASTKQEAIFVRPTTDGRIMGFGCRDTLATGAITSLAVASINPAPWDLRLKRNGKPLSVSAGSCGVKVPLDFSRVGGITPWLTVAHLAEACDVSAHTHCRMELHVSLACAVPDGHFIGRMPQLRAITERQRKRRNDMAMAPRTFGLGIDGDLEAVDRVRVA